jgi:hypothetical protein
METKHTPTLAEALDAQLARAEQGPWYPASGGTETPFVTRSGYRLLYMFQPSTRTHAHLNLDTDTFIDDSEIDAILA